MPVKMFFNMLLTNMLRPFGHGASLSALPVCRRGQSAADGVRFGKAGVKIYNSFYM